MLYRSPSRYAQKSNEDLPNNMYYHFSPNAFIRGMVSYSVGEAPTKTFQTMPDVDSIRCKFPSLIKGEGCFEFLQSNGLESSLTQHFIDCERKNQSYTLPTNNKVVIVKVLVQAKGTDKNKKGENKPLSPMLLLNSFENIKSIGMLDPKFFLNLVIACERGLCEFSSIDLFVDFGHNIMKYLLIPVLEGKVQSFGEGQIKVFGKAGDEIYEGKLVGLQNKAFTYLNKLSKVEKAESVLHTVYIGTTKYCPHLVCFYNKEKHKANKNQQQTYFTSRAEIRLNTRSNNFYKTLLPWLVLSIVSPTGSIYRQAVFVLILFSFCSVTTVQQIRNRENSIVDLNYWSSWWIRLFELSIHLISPIYEGDEPQAAFFVLEKYGHYFDSVIQLWKTDKSPEKLANCIYEFYVDLVNDLTSNSEPFIPLPGIPSFTKQPQHLPQAFSPWDVQVNEKMDILWESLRQTKVAIQPENYWWLFTTKEYFLSTQKKPKTKQLALDVLNFNSAFSKHENYDEILALNLARSFNQEQKTNNGNFELLLDLFSNTKILLDYFYDCRHNSEAQLVVYESNLDSCKYIN